MFFKIGVYWVLYWFRTKPILQKCIYMFKNVYVIACEKYKLEYTGLAQIDTCASRRSFLVMSGYNRICVITVMALTQTLSSWQTESLYNMIVLILMETVCIYVFFHPNYRSQNPLTAWQTTKSQEPRKGLQWKFAQS